MIGINIILDGNNAWPDLKERDVMQGNIVSVAALAGGMKSGAASVAFRIETPEGLIIIAQTSAALFVNAARAIAARHNIQ
jgi:hypothetical protein